MSDSASSNPENPHSPTWVEFKPQAAAIPPQPLVPEPVVTPLPVVIPQPVPAVTPEPPPLPSVPAPEPTPPVAAPTPLPPTLPTPPVETIVSPLPQPLNPVLIAPQPMSPQPVSPEPISVTPEFSLPITQPSTEKTIPFEPTEPIIQIRPNPPVEVLTPKVASTNVPVSGWSRVMSVVLTVALLAVLVAFGYFFYSGRINLSQISTPPKSSVNAGPNLGGSENSAILNQSQGPSSWERNYSTDLLASERGGLEFVIIDPLVPSVLGQASSSATAQTSVDLSSLRIKIAKVEVHLVNQSVEATGTQPTATKSANKSVDKWETLRLNLNNVLDLMTLRSTKEESTLGVTYLAAGHYSEIRIYITQASATTKDGQEIPLEINESNGIVKITKVFDISNVGTAKLTIDFDAPKSITKSGSAYSFSPIVAKVLLGGKEI